MIRELCPDGVEYVKLNSVCDIYDGTHSTPNYTESGVKFASVENIGNLYATRKYISDKDFEKYLYFSSDKVECYDIEKHKLFEIDYDDFYEVDLSLKQKVVCMLVTTRNQQYSFECKQDARFLQIIDLFEQKKIRYIDRSHFISIKR